MAKLRIVGGRLGSRRFEGPLGDLPVRPTAERVREAIASALEARGAIEACAVLDLFAGSGALGFECVSRGATRVVFVERNVKLARRLDEVAEELDVARSVDTLRMDLSRAPERVAAELEPHGPFDLVLVDPPYDDAACVPPLLSAMRAQGALSDRARVVFEHAQKARFDAPAGFELEHHYRYGDTAVDLLAVSAPA